MCTIAHTPRLPEHCVEFVKVIQWDRDKPFAGKDFKTQCRDTYGKEDFLLLTVYFF